MRELLKRARVFVVQDAQMAADITRHSPLDAASQAIHDSTETESEKLLVEIDARLLAEDWLLCERLYPDPGKRVYVSTGHSVAIRFLSKANDELTLMWANPDCDGWERLKKYKYWMPLPELPKGDKR